MTIYIWKREAEGIRGGKRANKMSAYNQQNQKSYDSYRVGGVSYIKETHLGPKTWSKIQDQNAGKFVDILEAKFKNFVEPKKIYTV